MSRVIDDLRSFIGDEFELDDIDSIVASRFEGAFSEGDTLNVISNLENFAPRLVKEQIGLYDERIPGTHSYGVTLVSGSYWCCPIW